MRFLHTADLHLGAEPDAGKAHSPNRGKEIWDSFARLIDTCQEQSVDILLIAGDLFHRQPLMRELKEVNYLFGKIPDTQVVLIAGNHDYLKPGSYALNFPWASNVHTLYSDKPETVEFSELQLCVYGLSYHRKEITAPLYDTVKAEGKQPMEILLAHGGDEKHIPIKKALLASSGFDYIALGHIHKPQELVKNRVVYAGAPEPLDMNETGKHGYIMGEITKDGVVVRFIPCAVREYKHLQLKVNEQTTERKILEMLKETIEELGKEHIYKIMVKGFRDPDLEYIPEHLDPYGNIIRIEDKTMPFYDFEKLRFQNQGNLLGNYIEELLGYEEDSLEYQALYEGVQALMETRGERI